MVRSGSTTKRIQTLIYAVSEQQTLQALETLQSLSRQSLIKSMGISNIYSPSLLRWLIAETNKSASDAGGIGISIIQNRWHEGNGWDWESTPISTFRQGTRADAVKDSRRYLQGEQHSISVCHLYVYLQGSINTEPDLRFLVTRYRSFWTLSGNPNVLAHPMIRSLAKKYSLTAEQALFRFCIS